MEPFRRKISTVDFRLPLLAAALLVLAAFSFGCQSPAGPAGVGPADTVTNDAGPTDAGAVSETEAAGGPAAAPAPTPASESLACPDCELVEVFEVVDADTVRTSIGEIQMYGAFVIDQPADCAVLARERLAALAGDAVRVEPGPTDTVRVNSNAYYLFTTDGQSIEETLVREGLALVWTQDGQHVGWFLFRAIDAKESEAGCLWKDYNAFQRGEPNEFRIPGVTYPDSG